MDVDQPVKVDSVLDIPARLVIGVTGHRKLSARSELIEQIRSTIDNIKKILPPLRNTPLMLSVLSPLAEGADRLVAHEVLSIPGSTLEIVLPMTKADYLQDFVTDQSKTEFEELFSRAISVKELQSMNSRDEAYEQVGRYIVDHCDVLIALWDGKQASGCGGTGHIVEYARDNGCPLYWINTENTGQVVNEWGQGLIVRPFKDLDQYNSEKVDIAGFEKRFNKQYANLINQTTEAQLPANILQPLFRYLQSHYFRADLMALQYQHTYHTTGNLVYILATAAVLLAAFQILFMPDWPMILIAEIVFMVAALAIVWLSRRHHWHRKWIDYRFLAELIRSSLFMAVSGMEVTTPNPPRHLSLSYSSNDWMVIAFSSVWSMRPRVRDVSSLPVEGLKNFLSKAWVEDQIRYHEGTSRCHYGRQKRMVWASTTLFGITLLAALLHVLSIGPDPIIRVFTLLAIGLPAIAASITAIRTHRDYLRNSMRSAEMVRHLTELNDRIMKTEDRESLLSLVAEVEQTMLHENEDWRVVVQFHVPELPV